MRKPGQGGAVEFRVYVRLDGATQATVRISPCDGGFTFEVKPLGRREAYRMSLGQAAEVVAWRAAKLNALATGRGR